LTIFRNTNKIKQINHIKTITKPARAAVDIRVILEAESCHCPSTLASVLMSDVLSSYTSCRLDAAVAFKHTLTASVQGGSKNATVIVFFLYNSVNNDWTVIILIHILHRDSWRQSTHV